LKEIPVERVKEFETKFIEEIKQNNKDILEMITQNKSLDETTENRIIDVVKKFTQTFLKK
jgi:F0F1-type ATP synthase alpha subunit